MKFILIMTLFAFDVPTSVGTAEFTTVHACINAGIAWAQEIKPTNQGMAGRFICMPVE